MTFYPVFDESGFVAAFWEKLSGKKLKFMPLSLAEVQSL